MQRSAKTRVTQTYPRARIGEHVKDSLHTSQRGFVSEVAYELGSARWDMAFRSKLGKAASKLYREIYGKDPPQKRASRDWRNKVAKYPCGILE
jgi:hypothetical protein